MLVGSKKKSGVFLKEIFSEKKSYFRYVKKGNFFYILLQARIKWEKRAWSTKLGCVYVFLADVHNRVKSFCSVLIGKLD